MRLQASFIGVCTLLGLAGLAGCDDGGSGGEPTRPSLRVVGSTECGTAVLPVPTREEFTQGTFRTLPISVGGTDPATSNQQIRTGTPVVISQEVVGDDGGQVVAFISAFEIASQQQNILEAVGLSQASDGITFIGGSATDRIFCTAPGQVFITARIDSYAPGGSGTPVAVETPSLARYRLQCVSAAQYEELCGNAPQPDEGVPDEGVDGGADDAGAGGMGGEGGMGGGPPPALWSIGFLPPMDLNDLIVGIRNAGLGRPDSVQLQFQVGESDRPLGNILVKFVLADITQPNVAISGGGTVLVDNSDEVIVRTDGNGIASVRLLAGGTPGLAVVRAVAVRPPADYEADCNDGTCVFDDLCGVGLRNVARAPECEEARSAVVTIIGGIPSHNGMQLTCDETIVPAFTERQGDRWLLANEPGSACEVQLADRVSGRVNLGTQIFFLSEAGTVNQIAATDADGRATTNLRVGNPAPKDVEAFPYEVRAGFDREGFNPRDGLVRVVAVTKGEEAFDDRNGNQIFEEGIDVLLPEHDLPEPFVDANDNGTYDDGEQFRDANNNDIWDEANGAWDSNGEIWVSSTVLWTGDLFSCWETFGNEYLGIADCGCNDPITGEELDPRPEGCTDNIAPARNLPAISFDCGPGGGCSTNQVFNELCGPATFYLDPGQGGSIDVTGRFFDMNGNCLGGRDGGRFSVNSQGLEPRNGQAAGGLSGRLCFNAFERPLGQPIQINMVDTQPANENNATTSTIEVTVNYVSTDGGMNQLTWRVSVCR